MSQTQYGGALTGRTVERMNLSPEAANMHNQAVGMHKAGEFDKAEKIYRDLLPHPAVYNNLGSLLFARGDRKEAEKMWESATELNPRMADAHGNLAKAALNDGDIKKAFEVLQRAVKVVPDNAALYTQLGGLYTASGRSLKSLPISDRKSAVKIAKTAASLSPLEPGLWNNLGLTLVSVGAKYDKAALQAFRRAMQLDPLHADYYIGTASLQPRIEAVRTLRAAIKLGPSARGPRGATYYNLGNLLQAHRYEEDAWRMLEPHERSAAYEAAEMADQNTTYGRYLFVARAMANEAAHCFRRATELQPTLIDAWYNAALAPQQAHIDNSSQAISDYTQALFLAPKDSKIVSRLVSTLTWAGRDKEAKDLAQRGVRDGLYKRYDQRPAHFINGLTSQPWHDTEVYSPITTALSDSHEMLLKALDAVTEAGWMKPQPEGLQEAGDVWNVFDIGASCDHDHPQGKPASDNAYLNWATDDDDGVGGSRKKKKEKKKPPSPPPLYPPLPEEGSALKALARQRLEPVCKLLSDLKASGASASPRYSPLKAQFSTMAAGVHVRPHTGPTNAKLTLHYGLRVPAAAVSPSSAAKDGSIKSLVSSHTGVGGKGCRIRVGNETRPFLSGGLIAFDDSYEHEVWQDGKSERTTLVLHVAHPDLEDINALTGGGIEALRRPPDVDDGSGPELLEKPTQKAKATPVDRDIQGLQSVSVDAKSGATKLSPQAEGAVAPDEEVSKPKKKKKRKAQA